MLGYTVFYPIGCWEIWKNHEILAKGQIPIDKNILYGIFFLVSLINMKSSFDVGLEPLALALILAPEPVTTVVGFGLLGYVGARQIGQRKGKACSRQRNRGYSQYAYRIYEDRGALTFQTFTTRTGQLPFNCSSMIKLYNEPHMWESYQKAAAQNYKTSGLIKG